VDGLRPWEEPEEKVPENEESKESLFEILLQDLEILLASALAVLLILTIWIGIKIKRQRKRAMRNRFGSMQQESQYSVEILSETRKVLVDAEEEEESKSGENSKIN